MPPSPLRCMILIAAAAAFLLFSICGVWPQRATAIPQKAYLRSIDKHGKNLYRSVNNRSWMNLETGINAENRVYLPVREVLTRLGGRTDFCEQGQMLTVNWKGHTITTPLLSDAQWEESNRPFRPTFAIWKINGVLYAPAAELSKALHLRLTPGARWRSMTVTDPAEGNNVSIPLHVWTRLRARQSQVLPIIITSKVQFLSTMKGLLIGGVAQHSYMTDKTMQCFTLDGQRYRFYALTGYQRTLNGTKAVEEPGAYTGWFVRLAAPLPETANWVGLRAAWNAMPRIPTPINAKSAPIQAWVTEILRKHGIAHPQIHVMQAMHVDLDRDEQAEDIVCATTPNPDYISEIHRAGDYSIVAVRSHGRTILLDAEIYPRIPPDDAWCNEFRIIGILDIDGDGNEEIITEYSGYEWYGYSVYRVSHGQARKLISWNF